MYYTHPDNHSLLNYDMTPGFKPFTITTLTPTCYLFLLKNLIMNAILLAREAHNIHKAKTLEPLGIFNKRDEL